MCPHTSKKRSKPLIESFKKNNLIKAHTLYPRGHQKKDVMIEQKQRQMPFNLK
jgi:hypothetical protein